MWRNSSRTSILWSASCPVCIAENQRENLRAMDSMDSTIFLEDIESDKWKAVLGDKVFNLLGDCGLRKTLSNNSLVVDGFGAQRISTATQIC